MIALVVLSALAMDPLGAVQGAIDLAYPQITTQERLDELSWEQLAMMLSTVGVGGHNSYHMVKHTLDQKRVPRFRYALNLFFAFDLLSRGLVMSNYRDPGVLAIPLFKPLELGVREGMRLLMEEAE